MRPSSFSGLLVLFAGLVALLVSTADPGTPPASVSVPPGTMSTDLVAPEPLVDGVSPAVTRVLHSEGAVEEIATDDSDQLAPEVARVLARYGATLVVADPSGSQR